MSKRMQAVIRAQGGTTRSSFHSDSNKNGKTGILCTLSIKLSFLHKIENFYYTIIICLK